MYQFKVIVGGGKDKRKTRVHPFINWFSYKNGYTEEGMVKFHLSEYQSLSSIPSSACERWCLTCGYENKYL